MKGLRGSFSRGGRDGPESDSSIFLFSPPGAVELEVSRVAEVGQENAVGVELVVIVVVGQIRDRPLPSLFRLSLLSTFVRDILSPLPTVSASRVFTPLLVLGPCTSSSGFSLPPGRSRPLASPLVKTRRQACSAQTTYREKKEHRKASGKKNVHGLEYSRVCMMDKKKLVGCVC